MMNNKQKGYLGESLAAAWLTVKGYRVLKRNYRTRLGEIDIIAKKAGYIIFVEVKLRFSTAMGKPREAVDYHKQRQIINTAKCFLSENGLYDNDIRFDVIEINGFKITHLKNAFM